MRILWALRTTRLFRLRPRWTPEFLSCFQSPLGLAGRPVSTRRSLLDRRCFFFSHRSFHPMECCSCIPCLASYVEPFYQISSYPDVP